MKKLSQSGELNEDTMLQIMAEQKKPERTDITLPGEKLRKSFRVCADIFVLWYDFNDITREEPFLTLLPLVTLSYNICSGQVNCSRVRDLLRKSAEGCGRLAAQAVPWEKLSLQEGSYDRRRTLCGVSPY